jgi:hypothetical protein
MKGDSLAESTTWPARRELVAYMSPRNFTWKSEGRRRPVIGQATIVSGGREIGTGKR